MVCIAGARRSQRIWLDLLLVLALRWIRGVCGAIDADTDPNIRKLPIRAQSLQAPYLDSDMQSRFFDFGEDTIVRADQYIRLTSDRQGQMGWIYSRNAMPATNWQIEVEFRIHGKGHLHGDGMAIWMTEERAKPGQVFGNTEVFNGLGVFIDTYKNQRPGTVFPYVMAMIGNETVRYNKDDDGKQQELAGCSARGIRSEDADSPTHRIRITYYQDTYLRVDLQYKDDKPDEWTECFETPPVKLPQTAYLGFTAETGELSDNHDIISVTAHNLHIRTDRPREPHLINAAGPGKKTPQQDQSKINHVKAEPFNPGGAKERGSWRWFFLKIILFGLVAVGGYVGFTVYRANRRSRF